MIRGIPIDWGRFPDYVTVLSQPRLELSSERRAVSFLVEVKRALPPGRVFMARFFDADGVEVKRSQVRFEPDLDIDGPGRRIASIAWVPDVSSVVMVKVTLE